MNIPFPFNEKTETSLHNLWDQRTYRFLANMVKTMRVDPNPAPNDHGVYEVTFNPDGTEFTIPMGGGSASYASYFRVINATVTLDSPLVGVTDGGYTGAPTNCGTVKINGVAITVPVFTSTDELTNGGTGQYYVWLHSWVDATAGEQAEIIVGDSDVETPPENPNGGLAYCSQLLGRVVAATDSGDNLIISTITQDYLRGGEHNEYLFGDCEGETIEAPP